MASSALKSRKAKAVVEVPAPEKDRPQFGRVGVIAVVGFAIGILWPRLAGVKLVPNVPVEESDNSSQVEAKPAGSGDAPPAAKVVEVKDEKPNPAADRIKLGPAVITSCRSESGAKHSECGELNVDSIAKDRILALSGCKAAEGVTGTLSLGLEFDFKNKRVTDVSSGKSTTLDDGRTKELLACATKEFSSASLASVEHKHSAYSVYYAVEFLPPGESAKDDKSGEGDVIAASGTATVGWQVALIRATPKEGTVVARILSGTRVVVTGRQGDWYRVKYDAKGNEGWVFRTAIGL